VRVKVAPKPGHQGLGLGTGRRTGGGPSHVIEKPNAK
jgi:hypothetical protein